MKDSTYQCFTCSKPLETAEYEKQLGYCLSCYVQELNLEYQQHARLSRERVIELAEMAFYKGPKPADAFGAESALYFSEQSGGTWQVFIGFMVPEGGFPMDPGGLFVMVDDETEQVRIDPVI